MIKRTDDNQFEIMKQLHQIGASVFSIHIIGKNVPDLVVGWRKKNFIFEVKNPDKVPSKKKLKEGQQLFFDTWKGQVARVETFEEIIKIINF